MRLLLSLLFIIISCSNPASSSTLLEEGHIKMEVTDVSSTIPGAESVGDALKGITHDIYFNPAEQLTVMNTLDGTNTRIYFMGQKVDQYVDMNDRKMLIKMNIEEWQKQSQRKNTNNTNIIYEKETHKEILGYDCYKAIVNMTLPQLPGLNEAPTMRIELYLTEDINLRHTSLQQLKGLNLEGTPLEIKMDMGMMSMTYKATSIDKSIDKSVFIRPQGAYSEVSIDALAGLNGSMNGF